MSSVSFQPRGRQRIPLSLYAPLRVTDEKPLYRVLSSSYVPQGRGDRDEQIGYWNQQPRWRMRRGERVLLPPNWHFYYLGTGPHADAPFRKRIDGVFWVAREGARTEPTKQGTRRPSEKPLVPKFDKPLPRGVEVVEPTTPPASRSTSRSQSRGKSQGRVRSPSSTRPNTRDQSRGNNRNSNSRSQSKSKSRNQTPSRGQSRDRYGGSREDLVSAVREALKSMGIGDKPKSTSRNASGAATPKKQKSRAPSKSRDPQSVPEWRRVPTPENSVEACFGPRGGFKNVGDGTFLQRGVQAPGYPQVASLVPNTAALLFGGNVATRELADSVEVTYIYKMTVPKTDPNLRLLLGQIDAYKSGSKPQRDRKPRSRRSSTSQEKVPEVVVNEPTLEWDSAVDQELGAVEIVNEVFDTVDDSSQV
nr:MAG: nucleocapsid protein [Pekapeka alphacoronavirus 1]WPA70782.1 MAG: nucleocapsid protein [Pekapeka alphacoronavirus 2]WPA70789.1 MAG: nucleocapsid protein [Pekapeka alphacoronavirus 1]